MTIRTFRNGDLPRLLDVWLRHWSSLGAAPHVDAARLEQAVLSRTFFDPANLLVAELDGTVGGWAHFVQDPTATREAIIVAICFADTVDEPFADALMTELLARIGRAGTDVVYAGVVRDEIAGYVGIEPVGHGIGIPAEDTRVTELLQRHGFSPERSVTRMTVSADRYRPPVSRGALQLRRTAKPQRESTIPSDPRHAASLSHIDIERHRLVSGRNERLASVEFWFSDPEAEVMSPLTSIINLGEIHQRGELTSAESYLIATVIQSLAARFISRVETAVDTVHAKLIGQLEAICFEDVEKGVQWKRLSQS